MENDNLTDLLVHEADAENETRCMAATLEMISAGEAFEFQRKVEEMKKNLGVSELELCPFEKKEKTNKIFEKSKIGDEDFYESESFEEFLKRTRTDNLIL